MRKIIVEELNGLLDTLTQYYPKSIMICHIIKNLLNGQFAWHGTEVIVDQYPDFSVCMTRQTGSEKGHVSIPTAAHQAVFLFAKDKQSLKNFVQEPELLDWKRKIVFIATSSEYVDTVNDLCSKYGSLLGTEERYRADVVILQMNAFRKLPKPDPLPADLHEGVLELKHVEQIAREWNFAGRGGNPEEVYPLLRETIGRKFPNIGIFNEKDELICYGMYDLSGITAKAHTREDYRNRGLWSYASYHLARKIFDQTGHEEMYGTIFTHNAPSLKVADKLTATGQFQTHTLYFVPC